MKNKIFVLVLLIYSPLTYAYLDPGSASLFIQGLIAAIASGLTIASLYWTKIKSFFLRKKNADKDSDKDHKE